MDSVSDPVGTWRRYGILGLQSSRIYGNTGNGVLSVGTVHLTGTTEVYNNGDSATADCDVNQYWTGTTQATAPYAKICQNCPIGRFAHRNNPSCILPCNVTGSIPQWGYSQYSCSLCLPGSYLNAIGDWTCSSCPAGRYGDRAGLNSSNCSGACSAGTQGSSGQISSECGKCEEKAWAFNIYQ